MLRPMMPRSWSIRRNCLRNLRSGKTISAWAAIAEMRFPSKLISSYVFSGMPVTPSSLATDIGNRVTSAPVSSSIGTPDLASPLPAFRTKTWATGAGGSNAFESYEGMELWPDDLHLEIGRLLGPGQARTSKMDVSRFRFHTGNEDIHLGAFRYVDFGV